MKNALLLLLLLTTQLIYAQSTTERETGTEQSWDNLKSYFNQKANLTLEEMKAMEGGMIHLVLVVSEEGTVPEAFIKRGAENCDSCREKIIQTAKTTVWEPATSGGEPVMVEYSIPLKF